MAYYPPDSPHWQQEPIQRGIRINKPIKIALACVAVVAIFFVFAMVFGIKVPPYQMGLSWDYGRDGVLGRCYQVALDPTCTDDQLYVVFNQVTKGDGYNKHTVGFWSSADLMNQGFGSDLASITDDSGKAVLERN